MNHVRHFPAHRWRNHAALLLISLAGIYAAHLYSPHADILYLLTIGPAYLSLLFLALTLCLGTLNLFRKRANPVNIDLRRDLGVWAGITGVVHVVFGLQIHRGGLLAAYFFQLNDDGTFNAPLTNLFGISNWIGALATLVLIALLVTSNDWSLKRLKGRRWKTLQRFNYALAVLTALHTWGYQVVSRREAPFGWAFVGMVVGVLVAQAVGFRVVRMRRERHRAFGRGGS